MKFRKVLFLFLALLLPVIIFIFLKYFGKNEFDVAPLFQDSIKSPEDCKYYQYAVPYTIPDSILSKLDWNNSDSITILIFDDGIPEKQHKKILQIERIFTEFSAEKFHILYVVEKDGSERIEPSNEKVKVSEIPHGSFVMVRNCIFLLKESDNTIIIDFRKRIRGQYNIDEIEDADRLVMQEMNILFKRY